MVREKKNVLTSMTLNEETLFMLGQMSKKDKKSKSMIVRTMIKERYVKFTLRGRR